MPGQAGGGDELFDGVEGELELLVVVGVFFFEGFDLLGEKGIGRFGIVAIPATQGDNALKPGMLERQHNQPIL